MFNIFKIILIPALLLSVSACSERINQHGHVIKERNLERIKVGLHDKRDVMNIMGSPSAASTFTDNTWYYMSEKTSSKPLTPNVMTERQLVILTFDESSKVSNIDRKTETDSKNIVREEKETATHGQSLGLFEQFFGNLGVGGF